VGLVRHAKRFSSLFRSRNFFHFFPQGVLLFSTMSAGAHLTYSQPVSYVISLLMNDSLTGPTLFGSSSPSLKSSLICIMTDCGTLFDFRRALMFLPTSSVPPFVANRAKRGSEPRLSNSKLYLIFLTLVNGYLTLVNLTFTRPYRLGNCMRNQGALSATYLSR